LNALIGANVTLFRRWEAFAEYGFNFNDIHISWPLDCRFASEPREPSRTQDGRDFGGHATA
jgi:hypothetical protein